MSLEFNSLRKNHKIKLAIFCVEKSLLLVKPSLKNKYKRALSLLKRHENGKATEEDCQQLADYISRQDYFYVNNNKWMYAAYCIEASLRYNLSAGHFMEHLLTAAQYASGSFHHQLKQGFSHAVTWTDTIKTSAKDKILSKEIPKELSTLFYELVNVDSIFEEEVLKI